MRRLALKLGSDGHLPVCKSKGVGMKEEKEEEKHVFEATRIPSMRDEAEFILPLWYNAFCK